MDDDTKLTQGKRVHVPNPKAGHPLYIIEYDINYVSDLEAGIVRKCFLPQSQ